MALAALDGAVAAGRLPAVALEVGATRRVLARIVWGTPVDALFDLASLTKPLATGMVAMHLLGRGRLALDAPVRQYCPDWTGDDRSSVTVRDLLAHAGGLPAHLPLYLSAAGRDEVVRLAAAAPLASVPRTASLYSDLGFIVLGDVLERTGGASLDRIVAPLLGSLSEDPPCFTPEAGRATVPTGWSTRHQRLLAGDVHDDNAAAMGGVAGHAGLFGSVRGVGDVARAMLSTLRAGVGLPFASPSVVRAFVRRSVVPGSSRALAWDTALPTSSCGPHVSRHAIGHTGFTGTSVWVDPDLDLYVVLLTNRVAGTATPDDMTGLRRAVHDAVAAGRRAVAHA